LGTASFGLSIVYRFIMSITPSTRNLLLLAAIAGFTGVLAGTFGAHGLKGRLSPEMLTTFEVGVRYHVIHAVALLGLAALSASVHNKWIVRVGWLFFTGIIIFAGSLYALAITGEQWLGMITPFGGQLFLIGWLAMGVCAWRMRTTGS